MAATGNILKAYWTNSCRQMENAGTGDPIRPCRGRAGGLTISASKADAQYPVNRDETAVIHEPPVGCRPA
jgi:hypothetical protein